MTRALARPPFAAAALVLAACATARGPAPARRAAAVAPVAAARPGWSVRALEVAGHGRLVLSLPPGWVVSEPGEGTLVTITKPGARFRVLLTPMWNPGEPESPQARADSAQLFAELARREALAGSVEREIPLEELGGPGVRGSYFSSTDRSLVGREARPDEFRHVLQGAAAVGPVILAFTLLDAGPGAWRADVLDVVRTARHVPDGAADDGSDAVEAMPGIQTEPLRVQLAGRGWAVLLDLPGFEIARVAPARMGPDTAHLIARSAEADIIASVILSPGDAARDAVACRERALARIQATVAGVEELRRAEGGGSAALTYVFRPGGAEPPEFHAHAFTWREGTCIAVHVSKAVPDAKDVARLDAILSSLRIAEDL